MMQMKRLTQIAMVLVTTAMCSRLTTSNTETAMAMALATMGMPSLSMPTKRWIPMAMVSATTPMRSRTMHRRRRTRTVTELVTTPISTPSSTTSSTAMATQSSTCWMPSRQIKLNGWMPMATVTATTPLETILMLSPNSPLNGQMSMVMGTAIIGGMLHGTRRQGSLVLANTSKGPLCRISALKLQAHQQPAVSLDALMMTAMGFRTCLKL